MKSVTVQNVVAWSVVTAAVALSVTGDPAHADTFGSGANSFNIDFVTVGNPGNAADTTGNPNPAGSVAYTYRMGKFDISEQMIDKANALGGLGITKDTRGPDKPATSASWNEAARFVNWLDTSTSSPPAYKFDLQPGDAGYDPNANIELWTPGDAGYNPANLYRNSQARYFLPSEDEWYKAAYYDPSKNGGAGGYWQFATGSNSAPTPVASGTGAGTAVYDQPSLQGPADITLAGGLSPYGTMGQGGNVDQWVETDYDLVNDSSSSLRAIRGGNWGNNSNALLSTYRSTGGPPSSEGIPIIGFRVASAPNPGGLLGDYNGNGTVDAADYTLWRDSLGSTTDLRADGDNSGTVDQADYDIWKTNFGNHSGSGAGAGAAVPEPPSYVLLVLTLVGFAIFRNRK